MSAAALLALILLSILALQVQASTTPLVLPKPPRLEARLSGLGLDGAHLEVRVEDACSIRALILPGSTPKAPGCVCTSVQVVVVAQDCPGHTARLELVVPWSTVPRATCCLRLYVNNVYVTTLTVPEDRASQEPPTDRPFLLVDPARLDVGEAVLQGSSGGTVELCLRVRHPPGARVYPLHQPPPQTAVYGQAPPLEAHDGTLVIHLLVLAPHQAAGATETTLCATIPQPRGGVVVVKANGAIVYQSQ